MAHSLVGEDDDDDTPLLIPPAPAMVRNLLDLDEHLIPDEQVGHVEVAGINDVGDIDVDELSDTSEDGLGRPEALTWKNEWRSIAGICLTLLFIHCQPSEAYLTNYLREDKGISEHELNEFVWPVDTYASLVSLIPIGFLAEAIGYRITVVGCLVCREVTRLILIYGEGVPAMSAMQATYAVATAGDTLLLTLAYMCVHKNVFKRVTVFAVCSQHLGSLVGSGIGQLMADRSSHLVNLFYVSWACTTCGLLCFAMLVRRPQRPTPVSLASLLRVEGLSHSWKILTEMYSNWPTQQWTLWWIFGYSANYMIGNYYQNQFTDVDPNAEMGVATIGMEACSIAGSLAALAASRSYVNVSSAIICISALAIASLYLLTTRSPVNATISGVAVANAFAFGIASFQVSAGSSVVATCAKDPRYSILFTVNVTLAFLWATILQAIGTATNLTTNGYFLLSAGNQAFLALIMACVTCYWVMLRRH